MATGGVIYRRITPANEEDTDRRRKFEQIDEALQSVVHAVDRLSKAQVPNAQGSSLAAQQSHADLQHLDEGDPHPQYVLHTELGGTTVVGVQTSVDFGAGATKVITTVPAPITPTVIVCMMAYDPMSGRDRDELEMDQFEVKAGNIVATDFDIIVTCLSGRAHGQYLLNYLVI